MTGSRRSSVLLNANSPSRTSSPSRYRASIMAPNATSSRPGSPRELSRQELISAADLATSPLFEEWRHGTQIALPLSIGRNAGWDDFPVPDIIRDIGNSLMHSGLPSWIPERILSEAHVNGTPEAPTSCSNVMAVELPPDEDFILRENFGRVREECYELRRSTSQMVVNAANWSIPVDNLVRRAFIGELVPKWTDGVEFALNFDLALSMPNTSTQLRVEDVCFASTVISTPLYPNPSMFNLNSQVYEELNVSLDRSTEALLCVPHVIVNHRDGSGSIDYASNELCFSLSAGLQQRKLLGREDHIIFGIACSTGKARIYASYWRGEEIQIVRLHIEDFDLLDPERCFLFFLFMTRLRRLIASFAQNLLTTDGTTIQKIMKATKSSWKANATNPPPPDVSWEVPKREKEKSRSRSS